MVFFENYLAWNSIELLAKYPVSLFDFMLFFTAFFANRAFQTIELHANYTAAFCSLRLREPLNPTCFVGGRSQNRKHLMWGDHP